MKASIVVPVYDEESGLPALLECLRNIEAHSEDILFEFILVDDHSDDETPRLLREAAERNSHFRYIRLANNSGSHVAILAGLELARGDCAVFLAADLQDPPELIPQLIESWREGNHVVWAVRAEREGIHWVERAFAATFYWLLRRVGMVEMPPRGSDFALLDRKVIDALLASVGPNPSLGGDIARLGFRQSQIPYVKAARMHGTSKWTLERKLRAFADAFVSFSYVPLRFMSYLGMASSMVGFLYAIFIIIVRLFGDKPITGWASTMVVVLVLGGVQMTMLGVLGEYLWRTLEAARRRPRYFVEDALNLDQDHPPEWKAHHAGNVEICHPPHPQQKNRETVN